MIFSDIALSTSLSCSFRATPTRGLDFSAAHRRRAPACRSAAAAPISSHARSTSATPHAWAKQPSAAVGRRRRRRSRSPGRCRPRRRCAAMPSSQRRRRGRVAIHVPVRERERPEQPAPHRALVIRAVALPTGRRRSAPTYAASLGARLRKPDAASAARARRRRRRRAPARARAARGRATPRRSGSDAA